MMLVKGHKSIIMTAIIMIASDMMNVIMIVIKTIIRKTSILTNMTLIAIIVRSLMEISITLTRIAKKKIMLCM